MRKNKKYYTMRLDRDSATGRLLGEVSQQLGLSVQDMMFGALVLFLKNPIESAAAMRQQAAEDSAKDDATDDE